MKTRLMRGPVTGLFLFLILIVIAVPDDAAAYRIRWEHYVFATGEGAVPVADEGILTDGPLSFAYSFTHVGDPAAGNSATVDYFADIDEAVLGAYASSVSAQADFWPYGFTGTGRVEQIQFEVTLSFLVPAGVYGDTIAFTVEGELDGSVAAYGQATARADFGVRFGTATWYPDMVQVGLEGDTTVPVDEAFTLVHKVALPGGVLDAPMTYQADLVCYLANLITSANETGSYPFKETGHSTDDFSAGLRITAVAGPAGSSWSSDTGVFLNEEDISAVRDLPAAPRLAGNVPNPFNPSTTIRYHLGEADRIDLAVFDVAGRRVRLLEAGPRDAGDHCVDWDGRSDAGDEVPSGVYFAVLRGTGTRDTLKMTLVR